jgi:hypothetical protein
MDRKHQGRGKSTRRNLAAGRLQDYRRYSTDPQDFQTWLDRVYSRFDLSIPGATALLGLLVYLAGLAMATSFGFGRQYISSPQIYVGVFGICLVSGVVRYASLRIHAVFENFRPCFMLDDAAYAAFIRRWFSRLSSDRGNLAASGVYALLALLLAYGEFFLSPLTGRVQYGAMKAYFFEPFWYQPENLWGKAIIIAFYGICVALPLGAATRLLYLNYAFMQEVGKLAVVPLMKSVRMRFRPMLDYYLYIVFTWSIGIALFGIVFFNGLQGDSIVFLSILNILGVGAFAGPQLCYRSYLRQSATVISGRALARFYSGLHIKLRERPVSMLASGDLRVDDGAETEEAGVGWWVYDLADLVIFLIAQVIVYGATLLQR